MMIINTSIIMTTSILVKVPAWLHRLAFWMALFSFSRYQQVLLVVTCSNCTCTKRSLPTGVQIVLIPNTALQWHAFVLIDTLITAKSSSKYSIRWEIGGMKRWWRELKTGLSNRKQKWGKLYWKCLKDKTGLSGRKQKLWKLYWTCPLDNTW